MRSFTLIETILVVTLVAILVTMLAPSLGQVRARARATKSLVQLKQHAGVFAAYAGANGDFMPYVTDPQVTWTVLRDRDRDLAVLVPYFGAHSAWNIPLAHEYYGGDSLSQVFHSPDEVEGMMPRTSYWYSCTFIADPRFWNPRFRSGPQQRRAVGAHEVSFPSQKGVLVDSVPWRTDFAMRQQIPCRVALADGSASTIAPGRLGEAHPGGESPGGGAVHGTTWPPVHHTLDGVRGRDIR